VGQGAGSGQDSYGGELDGGAQKSLGSEDPSYSSRHSSVVLMPSVPVDLLFDNHVVELEECRRWANSDAGQIARVENPAGFANVRAHAEAHLRAVGLAYAAQRGTANTPANSTNSGGRPGSSVEGKTN
jgi:hypothetical protein